jgi:hypothetical protein
LWFVGANHNCMITAREVRLWFVGLTTAA